MNNLDKAMEAEEKNPKNVGGNKKVNYQGGRGQYDKDQYILLTKKKKKTQKTPKREKCFSSIAKHF